jgi:polyisoprenoid-binding protein YceI
MTTATKSLTGSYTADPDHSSAQAGLRHMGVGSFRTTFAELQAQLTTDGAGPALEGSASVASISITNPPEFRAHVVDSPDFFDAASHPEIGFRTSRLVLAADGTVEFDGELRIKGIAKAVAGRGTWQGPLEDVYGGERLALDLEAAIDRREWSMNYQAELPSGGDVLGWEVAVEAHLELVKDG